MADEFQLGTGNWWDSTRSSTTRFDSTGPTPPTVSSTLSSMGSYESAGTGAGAGASLLADPNLHLMGLGLSSQNMDWNQALLRGGKSGSSFGTMLQDESTTTTNYQQQDEQWRQKLFDGNSDDSSNNCYNKQIDQSGVLSLDQQQYSSSNSSITCQGLNNNFQVDSTAYNNPTNVLLQGFLVSENQQQTNFDNRSLNYGYHPPPNYPLQTPVNNNQLTPPSWSKFPQLLRTSPPKQPPQLPPHGQLHFSNNTPYWNASSTTVNDGQPSFFSPLQTQVPPSSFLDRSKNTSSEIRESAGTVKKNSNEPLIKRSRQETTPPPAMPAFKVRKEKMGDRITALQQLVSPFGKTDTASVLSEAIEYIKFLHDQVSVLSTPYLKSAAPINPQLNSGNLHTQEVPKQDLKSRGLCLVPVSSTFPVTHETTVDFWTPTFGGTFR